MTFCHGLKLEASDGKKYETDCVDTGGRIAGNARKELEKELGGPIVSKKNYLGGGDKIKKLKSADNEKF